MKKTLLSLAVSALSLASLPVFGDTYQFSNDTTFLPLFNRPTADGSALSDVGTAVHYHVENFTVSQTGTYSLSAVAGDPGSFDTFIHLYSLFNPALPLSGFIAGNDDAFANADLGSALNNITLTAGNNYAFVITGFGNSDFGGFTASIVGPGSIAPVPEPSFYALLGCGAAGLLIAGRRR